MLKAPPLPKGGRRGLATCAAIVAALSLWSELLIPQTSTRTLQDFDTDGTGTPFYLRNDAGGLPHAFANGGPTAAGRFVRLAHETSPANANGIAFQRTAQGAHDVIVVDFDIRMTTDDTRADGFGFAFLHTTPYRSEGMVIPEPPLFAAEEPNFEDSIGIGFDIHKKGRTADDPGDLNDNHVSIHFDRVEQVERDVSEFVDLAGVEWLHVRAILRPGGGFHDVTVILTPLGGSPATVIDRFVVPGFSPYEGRLYFGARSGGSSADHDLDNVSAAFVTPTGGVVSFAGSVHSAIEGAPAVPLTLARALDLSGTATVHYETVGSGSSASAGADYVASTGSVTFLPGDVTKTVTIPLLDDGAPEAEESFRVRLVGATGAAVGGPSTAAVTIVDDENGRQYGHWTSPFDWLVVPIHLHLLPTGEILFFEGGGEDAGHAEFTEVRLWNPATRAIRKPALPGYDIFCSGHSLLPGGGLFVTGGHVADNTGFPNAAIYSPYRNVWTQVPAMNAGRWYPTNTALANGDVLVVSGEITPGNPNPLPQVWDLARWGWRDLHGALGTPPNTGLLYPRMFLAPDGRVFKAGGDVPTGFLDPSGAGSWVVAPSRNPNRNVANRDYGAAVMYDGTVMLMGGGSGDLDPNPPTNTVERIDLNNVEAGWAAGAPMQFARRHHNATLLPTGEVLVTGGTSLPGFQTAAGAVLNPELWAPADTWTPMAPMAFKSLYHSSALLLPDGRVVAGGGGRPSPAGERDQKKGQIFSPPYLFRGPRPVIASAPRVVSYGRVFAIETAAAPTIARVTLIRLGSVTHAFDQNQRLVTLPFTAAAGRLDVTMPLNPNVAPAGDYMLFIVTTSNVPSVASMVRIEGFSDESIVAGMTLVRAVHLDELRARINLLRHRHGLASYAWAVPTLAGAVVDEAHFTELRTALAQAYAAAGRAPTFDTPPPVPGDPIRASDITTLRQTVRTLEALQHP